METKLKENVLHSPTWSALGYLSHLGFLENSRLRSHTTPDANPSQASAQLIGLRQVILFSKPQYPQLQRE